MRLIRPDSAKMFSLPGTKEKVVSVSNKTPISRRSGMVHLNCDQCDLPIMKPAAWAKRSNHHFCGVGCSGAFRRIPLKAICSVCGVQYEGTRSVVLKSTTCRTKDCIRIGQLRAQLAITHAAKVKALTTESPLNTSGHKGVYWDKARNKWMASMTHFGKSYRFGRFDKLEDAIRAADDGRRRVLNHRIVN
jgi:hypothetical protein